MLQKHVCRNKTFCNMFIENMLQLHVYKDNAAATCLMLQKHVYSNHVAAPCLLRKCCSKMFNVAETCL